MHLTVGNPLAGVVMALPKTVRASGSDAIEWQRECWPPEHGKGSLPTTMIDLSERYGFLAGDSTRGCLTAFLKLANADVEQVVRFASQWGVLGFCGHDLPGVHASCPPRTSPDGMWYREPIDKWRSCAEYFRGLMLELNARASGHPITGGTPGMMMIDSAEGIAALLVSKTLAEAGIAPRIIWKPKQGTSNGRFDFGLSLGSGGVGATVATPATYGQEAFVWPHGSLYPVLAVQLAAAVTGGRLGLCSECREPFDWADAGYERSPRYDRGTYCGEWCRNESRRRQKREWARRNGQHHQKEGDAS